MLSQASLLVMALAVLEAVMAHGKLMLGFI